MSTIFVSAADFVDLDLYPIDRDCQERLDIAPAEIYGVATFYALFDTNERPARQVHVCVDLACRAASGCTEETLPEGAIASPCLGTCERAAQRTNTNNFGVTKR